MIDQPQLTVDLAAIVENWRSLNALSGDAECGAVCKADAYGLGAERVAAALLTAGARSFFTATLSEALQLRKALGPDPRIYVLNGAQGSGIKEAENAGLMPVLSARPQLEDALAHASATGRSLACALHADSGMNRLGLDTTDLDWLQNFGESSRLLDVRLAISHLARADDPQNPSNAAQAERFDAACNTLRTMYPQARPSLSATAGLMLGGRYLQRMTRPGIGLYGGLPFADARRAVRLEAPILQISEVGQGQTVGYGGDWTSHRPSRIATLAIGYGDGVPRSFAQNGAVWIGRKRAPLAGRVNMDLMTVDVTDAPDAHVSGLVEILGPNQSVDDMARATGTIGHEVLAALHGRCQRRYLDATNSGEETSG